MKPAAVRPKDAQRTRERILLAARREFARVGFARATVREIASAAEVSANLITRYFGGKDGLFVAASEVHLKLDRLFDGPRASLGQRMADGIVNRWTTMEGEDPLLVLLRAAGERREAAEALSAFLDEESLEPLRRKFLQCGMTAEDAAARAQAIDILVVGVSARLRVLRHDLGDTDALKRWLAVTIQRLVDAA